MSEVVRAIGKNILIKRRPKKITTDGGILLPSAVEGDDYAFAEVLSTSGSYYDEKLKKEVSIDVKAGDIILYRPQSAMQISGGHSMIDQDNIFAIIEE